MKSRWNGAAVCGFLILSCLIILGSFRAYTRGGNDFSVFYTAWQLVLSGKGNDIYRVSPDRFLYGPGFAWMLSPLGLLPRPFSLGVWCLAKAGVVAFLIRKFTQSWSSPLTLTAAGLSAWGAILIARPLLIDFEYGQVNLLILGACTWGLLGHFEKEAHPFWDLFRWFILSISALAKLFPLPLLLVPWFVAQGVPRQKLHYERAGIALSWVATFGIPLLSQGFAGTFRLLSEWKDAVLARGLPLESHNQSFTAFLYHYLSGNPTSVLSEGSQPLFFGHALLSSGQIGLLSLFWTITGMGIILGWIVAGTQSKVVPWVSVLVGLMIVPSHLIWKPYFVMSLPLAILIVQQLFQRPEPKAWGIALGLFGVINLTGFDFVGHVWAAHFEAASLLLLAHLTMIVLGRKGAALKLGESYLG